MVILINSTQYIGPFKTIEELSDRLRCDGSTDLPFNVIGQYEIFEDDSLAPIYVPETPVPTSVSMRQARLQLLALDSLATVNAAIATMPASAQIEWEYATEVQRSNPLVAALAGLLGWGEDDTDSYFREAVKG